MVEGAVIVCVVLGLVVCWLLAEPQRSHGGWREHPPRKPPPPAPPPPLKDGWFRGPDGRAYGEVPPPPPPAPEVCPGHGRPIVNRMCDCCMAYGGPWGPPKPEPNR